MLRRCDVDLEDPTQLTWKRYRSTPVNVNRGTCRTCGTSILEHLALSPLSIVIAGTWEDPELLPPSQGHVFYETRVGVVGVLFVISSRLKKNYPKQPR